ncbi:DDT domain-containing protein PTM-like [Telopea speciosissima]|uniref:DDT domain-containing protein PTM-like n=1 Tax=Telopea speciosissima TaxID=54955 RepID=UPI001CC76F9D|nr:DDT domain-containing protein PTM-like [Telopea speciosissima]
MEFVGRTLKKRFRGFGTFSGVVESYDSDSGLFKIIYEDGDSEEMELGEVDSILKGIDVGEADEPVEKRRRGRPKKRRRREAGAAVRDGSGNSADSLVNDRCSGEGSEDAQMKGNVSCGGFSRNLEKECELGGNLKESVSANANLKGSDFSMLQLEEDNSHAGSASKGSENDLGCPSKEEPSQKKRRRLSENFKPTTETLLRRSTRRARAAVSSTKHALITEEFHETDTPAVNSVSDEKPVSPGFSGLVEPSRLPPKLALLPSSKNLNLDKIPILDLFSVYSFLRSFGTSLFLSPFDLEAFVAAVKCKFANSLIDFIHFSILQTLKLHLEFLSKEGPESASACLRVLNWEFLDLITWPVFLVEYLLIRDSELKPGFDLCQLKLMDDDYYKPPAALKVEILRCLCDDVIEVEAIRMELNRRMLSSELDLDIDRNVSFVGNKKKKDPVDDLGGSCFTQEMVDETNDWNSDECCLCKMDGSLICCDGCPAAYHSRCVGILKDLLPEGEWYCPGCVVGKRDLQRKSPRSLCGAELLGIDHYGRVYFGSCGYLVQVCYLGAV